MAAEQFCKNCGSKIDPGARFCSNCGSPILSKPPYISESPKTAPNRSMTPSPRQQTRYPPPAGLERHTIIARKQKSPELAAILSFFVTGLDQIYVGAFGRGIAFIVVAVICLSTFFVTFLLFTILFGIGIFLVIIWWIYGIFDAFNIAKQHNEDLLKLAW